MPIYGPLEDCHFSEHPEPPGDTSPVLCHPHTKQVPATSHQPPATHRNLPGFACFLGVCGCLGRWGLGRNLLLEAGRPPETKKSRGFNVTPKSPPKSGLRTCGSNLLFGSQCLGLGKNVHQSYIFQTNLPASQGWEGLFGFFPSTLTTQNPRGAQDGNGSESAFRRWAQHC